MLSKSGARTFFLVGTVACFGAFVLLTLDTLAAIPDQTREHAMNDSVIRGKHLWDVNNCMGCHTLYGEGAYYAPELTKVYDRRGPAFIGAMLRDPEAMYPGQRRMVKYDFNDQQIEDMVAFFEWIGKVDLNGFPPEPVLTQIAVIAESTSAHNENRPKIFDQLCIACHSLGGKGGRVGPALDGVGKRFDRDYLERWLRDPLKINPKSLMPKLPLTDEQIANLVAFLSKI